MVDKNKDTEIWGGSVEDFGWGGNKINTIAAMYLTLWYYRWYARNSFMERKYDYSLEWNFRQLVICSR